MARGPEEGFETTIEMLSDPGTDLFPEGFEDPETGTPLEAACIEIGIDDVLDADCPVDVTSASIQFQTPGGPVFQEPIDITEAFSPNLWNGKMLVSLPNLAGMGINGVTIRLGMQPGADSAIFADGFESGDASAWTDQVP